MLNDLLRGRHRRAALTGVAAISATLAMAAPALAAAPGTPDMVSASDSGTSSTDNITNATSPNFTGTQAGTVVVEYKACPTGSCNGGSGWNGYANAPGSPTYSTAGQTKAVLTPDGRYAISARNTTTNERSNSLIVVIDTTAPTVSTPNMLSADDTGVSSSDNVTTDTSPRFTGTTSENSRTELLIDGSEDDEELTYLTSSYGTLLDISADTLSIGFHTAQARAYDVAGNLGYSGTLQFEITVVGCDQGPATLGTSGVDFFVPAAPKAEPDFVSTNASQRFEAGGGNDRLEGIGGNDCLRGQDDDDQIDGGSGNDRLEGGSGDDEIDGGSGADRIYGGSGDDEIDAGSGDDVVIDGGSGNDTIDSRDGNAETVDCDSGAFDTVIADESDTLIGCENVKL
ncbi:Ig-like domain-containing protein [Conexibacter sp. SYSU D00693]|uniref:Ig-like domain-containing protein n=1 Tax=Conexibacter sp. SYSU D00693 TaxID=2812560 RepID=UPI00196B71DF|nr:Ig-like domain-containing protein [Conexibacter sp. SYSU D00693]